jgi:hypothetical protein
MPNRVETQNCFVPVNFVKYVPADGKVSINWEELFTDHKLKFKTAIDDVRLPDECRYIGVDYFLVVIIPKIIGNIISQMRVL